MWRPITLLILLDPSLTSVIYECDTHFESASHVETHFSNNIRLDILKASPALIWKM